MVVMQRVYALVQEWRNLRRDALLGGWRADIYKRIE